MQNLGKLPQIETQGYGQESLSFRGSLLWNTLDDNDKNEPTCLLSKRDSKTGLMINAPAKETANFYV